MKILIGCEFTGTVRRAFTAAHPEHDIWSCDLLPSLDRSNRHIVGDVRTVLNDGWDLLAVLHPPCTRLCNSGVRWITTPPPGKTHAQIQRELEEGADLFSTLLNCDIPRKCIENPVMHKHAKALIRNYREFSQSVQPWMFGDFETKRTCLWLENLPPLTPTFDTIEACRIALGLPEDAKPTARVHLASPGPQRWAERSKICDGIANAMAGWGSLSPIISRKMAA